MSIKQDGALQVTQAALDELWLKQSGIETVADRNWRLPQSYLQTHLIIVAVSGQVQVVFGGRHHSLAAGSAIVCLPGQRVKAAADVREDVVLYVMTFAARVDRAGHSPEHGGFNLEAIRQANPDFIIGVDHFVPRDEQQSSSSWRWRCLYRGRRTTGARICSWWPPFSATRRRLAHGL